MSCLLALVLVFAGYGRGAVVEAPVMAALPLAPAAAIGAPAFGVSAPSLVSSFAPSLALAAPSAAPALAAAPAAPVFAAAPSAAAPEATPAAALQVQALAASAGRAPDAAPAAASRSSGFDGPAARSAPAPTALGDDAIVYRGWQLAQRSKSQRARFGAVVVDKDGRVVGEGWNRRSTKAERRFLRIGLIMHAEQAAVFQAAKTLGRDLEGVRLFVVGVSKDATRYASKISPGIACDICARILQRNKVDVMSSSKNGFVRLAWQDLVALAKSHQGRKWWQASYKGKPQDPNIRWLPIADVRERLDASGR